jgi:hypothetical protein
MPKIKSRNGQIGLLVLLATIVVMTIAVALASRTASEIAISTNEEQSTSAFESAETIIERILGNPTPPPVNMSGSIGSETYQVETVYATRLDTDTKSTGETVEVNLQGYSAGDIKVSWQGGDGTDCQVNATAIVAAVFYKDGANYRVKRSAFDPCNARKVSNGFDGAVSIIDGRPTANIITQQGTWTPVSARIKLLYADSNLSVSGGVGFPPQGREITSRASSLDDQSRAIRVTEGHPMAPSIFDYAVYSAGTIENVGP